MVLLDHFGDQCNAYDLAETPKSSRECYIFLQKHASYVLKWSKLLPILYWMLGLELYNVV